MKKVFFIILSAVVVVSLSVGVWAISTPRIETVDNSKESAATLQDNVLNVNDDTKMQKKELDDLKNMFGFDLPDLSKYDGMTNEEKTVAIKEDSKVILDKLIKNGTITQEQADKITNIMLSFDLIDFSKYESMNDEEKAAAAKEDFKVILGELIKNGVISQEHFDKIENYKGKFDLSEKDLTDFNFPFDLSDILKYYDMSDAADIKDNFGDILDKFLGNGDITQEQADMITNIFEKFAPAIR